MDRVGAEGLQTPPDTEREQRKDTSEHKRHYNLVGDPVRE